MHAYIARRVLQSLYVLVALSMVIFFLIRFAPGNPSVIRLGFTEDMNAHEARKRDEAELGLDKPIYVQYYKWATHVIRGDFGVTVTLGIGVDVRTLVLEKAKRSLPMAGTAMLIGVAFAIPLGLIAGTRPNTFIDHAVTAFSLFGVAAPSFWVGLMLILFFAVRLNWFPTSGYGPIDGGFSFHNLVLPASTLGIQIIGGLTRFMRSGMLDVMSSDYVRTAHAKGLKYWAVVMRHALKNALLVVVTVVALTFGGLLTGSVVTETVFAWPGLGQLLVTAIKRLDYGVVQAAVLLAGSSFIFVNLIADIAYGYLDPRIRYQ
jgi:peptide/nickel transport system permease protein